MACHLWSWNRKYSLGNRWDLPCTAKRNLSNEEAGDICSSPVQPLLFTPPMNYNCNTNPYNTDNSHNHPTSNTEVPQNGFMPGHQAGPPGFLPSSGGAGYLYQSSAVGQVDGAYMNTIPQQQGYTGFPPSSGGAGYLYQSSAVGQADGAYMNTIPQQPGYIGFPPSSGRTEHSYLSQQLSGQPDWTHNQGSSMASQQEYAYTGFPPSPGGTEFLDQSPTIGWSGQAGGTHYQQPEYTRFPASYSEVGLSGAPHVTYTPSSCKQLFSFVILRN